ARDPRELITVVSDNRKHGVETLFVKLDHETAGRIGEMILYMKGFASALEWDQIRDRTMRARMEIINSGKWFGGGPVRYGYRFDRTTRSRTANPETSPVVVEIFRMAAEELTIVQISAELNRRGILCPSAYRNQRFKDGEPRRWNATTVLQIIKDRTYLGQA